MPKYYIKKAKEVHFVFLNSVHSFESDDKIDWNYASKGKLWCYNLNYFDYLNQVEMTYDDGMTLIHSYINNTHSLKDGLEPYPISLRNINWIKFCMRHQFRDSNVDGFIFSGYQHLLKNLEYHLLGNHLLENGYSLFFGALYFRDKNLYKKAIQILQSELNEQILLDGAHFELSPMYHQILLERLLDCINLAKNSDDFVDQSFFYFMESKAISMLSWLSEITFKNGDIPLLNDSSLGIASSSSTIFNYARSLDIVWTPSCVLSESGYRKRVSDKWEFVLDIGKIGPDYIPGHAHADTFSFVMHYSGKPFLVDPGISTYEKNERRNFERGTSFHNTVCVNGKNQSDVWGGFRVGKRAKVSIVEDSKDKISAFHGGYSSFGVTHQRSWRFDSDESILIEDVINKKGKRKLLNEAFFYFAPDIVPEWESSSIISFAGLDCKMHFSGSVFDFRIEDYECPQGYNKFVTAKRLVVTFSNSLITLIR
ncbi:alginate lyase family protein [Shiella aurantiaca]|uniref:alginate lyase family protein n=1 Tax=Shiella aurantiaca TaxID=3058365 RepID=UPI0029F5B508|nr:alginate lyase family protein [Shiella aurantiaca]